MSLILYHLATYHSMHDVLLLFVYFNIIIIIIIIIIINLVINMDNASLRLEPK